MYLLNYFNLLLVYIIQLHPLSSTSNFLVYLFMFIVEQSLQMMFTHHKVKLVLLNLIKYHQSMVVLLNLRQFWIHTPKDLDRK